MQLGLSPDKIGRWALGGIGAVVFLLGLFLASRGSGEFSTAGLFVALFSLLLIFWQIKRGFDAYDADPDRPRKPAYAAPVQPVHSTPPKLPTDHNPDAHARVQRPPHVFEGGWQGVKRPAKQVFDPDTQTLAKGIVLAALALFSLFVGASGEGWAYYGGIAAAFFFAALIVRLVVGPQVDLFPAEGIWRWIVGGLVGVGALIALMVASLSAAGPGYYFGLIVFGLALAYLFYLIKASFDEAESH